MAVAEYVDRKAAPEAGLHAPERLDRLPVSRWLTRVMAILFLGWLMESYDVGLIGSVLPSLSAVFHLNTGLESVAAIASAVGIVLGIVPAGRLADRCGRKRVMVAGTVVYAVLTFLTGLAPDIAVLIVLRVLAGIAMGAVFPLPYAYAAELCPPSIRGRFTGIADSFLSVGYFLSPLLSLALIPSVADDTGWRVMFFLGGLPVIFAFLVWKYVPESPRWYEARNRIADAERVLKEIEARVEAELGRPLPPPPTVRPVAEAGTDSSIRTLFGRRYLRRSATLWTTFGGIFFVFYSIQTFMPTVVTSMGFTLTSAFAFTAAIVGASVPGKLLEAWLVERWGRRRVIITFGAVAAVAAFAFGFTRGAVAVLLVGCVMSFFGIGADPAVKVYTAESYPTAIRATGTAVTEGVGRLLSGVIGPSLVPLLLAAGGVVAVYTLVGGVALVAVATVAVFGEETMGRSLEAITPPAERTRPTLAGRR
ncbi:MAG: transporter, putative metabolite:H+ symporter [Solirubrobacteraceae bacterium]|jgi:putative MFS transporter|nr:transporter, putative metabolite:H+ symporter [Solirubrobacteraceae bacterium]